VQRAPPLRPEFMVGLVALDPPYSFPVSTATMKNAEHQDSESALCPHCAMPLEGNEHFCDHCGCPVTGQAVSMPYESVFARGFAWREGSARPRKLIVVIGMWMMFSPMLLVSLITIVAMLVGPRSVIREPGSLADVLVSILGLGLMVALAAVSGLLLVKTTRNYLKFRQTKEEDDREDDQEDDRK
jgi:hypothetical protein